MHGLTNLKTSLYSWLVCPMRHFSHSQKMLHMSGDFWSRSILKRCNNPHEFPRWQTDLLDAVL